MKRTHVLLIATVAVCLVVAIAGSFLSAQEQLRSGKILQRVNVVGATGMEAILVLRELPPGAESGKHTQSGTEIVYILEGSSTVEIDGKSPQTLKAGEAFTTSAGQVHNVKNASSNAPAKALAFYIAKKGARLEDLSRPAK